MLTVLLGLLHVCGGTALALDPGKAITQYTQTVWQSEQGLPTNGITVITQTRDGYMWVGTEDGLARFDGVRFTVFNKSNTPGLMHNRIMALVESDDGSLWIGTMGGGLTRYKDGRFRNYSTPDGLSQDLVSAIAKSRDGSLWISTFNGGLNHFKDEQFKLYTTKEGLPSQNIGPVFEDQEGRLWIGSDKGLTKLVNERFTTYTAKDGLPSDEISSITQGENGALLIVTADGGVATLESGKFTINTTKDSHLSSIVTKALTDREGNLWVTTYGSGIARFNDGKFTTYAVKNGLPNDLATAIYEDRESNLWIGTQGGGLVRLRDATFTTFGTLEGLSNEMVWSVFEGHDGSLWVGTSGGLSNFKDRKFTTYTTRDGLTGNVVISLGEGRDGSLWVGTEGGGLSRFKDGKFTRFAPSQNGPGAKVSVAAIHEDQTGTVWIATKGEGLYSFKYGKFKAYTTSEGLPSNIVRAIHESKDGSLWLGTSGGGLSHFKDGKFTNYSTKEGLSHNIVLMIYEDQDGALWIATLGGGLSRFKDGRFTAYMTSSGFFDDYVYRILEDDAQNLWMSCNKGVFRVSKKELNDYAEGRINSVATFAYGAADGMRSSECNGGNESAGTKTRDGRLWFPTVKGLVTVAPSKLSSNQLPPPIVIEQVISNKEAIDLRGAVSLPPGGDKLEFHYTALSFVAPEKVNFKYKLEGFDRDWVDAGTRREAFYTNLPPRSYKFRVIASNNDGVWNETGASVDFYLQPYFYQTKWFLAVCILAALLSGFFLYRYRLRHLRERARKLEDLVDHRTQELKRSQEQVLLLEKQATEQQMAGGFAHEMRNALAGSKLILDQALALDGAEPNVSLNLANCRSLKEIYLELGATLNEEKLSAVLAKMQTIFGNEERLNEVLQLVRKATTRGLKITQQIMDYSRLGQQQAGHKTVNFDEIILGIIEESSEEFLTLGVNLKYKPDEKPAYVTGDETQFYCLMKNLILNARDALADPAVRKNADRRIEVSSKQEDDDWIFVVADNGVGIPKQNLPKMFEPFFSTKPATGTGLGLGMVKKIVALYSGQINIVSEVGKGTSFAISIPHSAPTGVLTRSSGDQ